MSDFSVEGDLTAVLPDVDPGGLLEYSVVFTDRSLNHMSKAFQRVMNDISATLKEVYNAHSVAVVPGGGTFAMEAVARQFATDRACLILRNGWFSFRWTQILEAGAIDSGAAVLAARAMGDNRFAPFAPAAVDEVVATIQADRPDVVFVPHVETSSGIILGDDYLRRVGEATRAAGGLLVLDCIASGAMWVDMEDIGVDVLISAPQKGWSGTPCAGLVMLSRHARSRIEDTTSTSFACDLKRWLAIMEAYEGGGHAYHATMPTDSLKRFRDVMKETEAYGLERARAHQQELGNRVRAVLEGRGFPSVAADGFRAPGVVVSYTNDPQIKSGKKFAEAGVQIAGGVPLRCGEPEDFMTFRIGLFGLDKLQNVERTVERLEAALDRVA